MVLELTQYVTQQVLEQRGMLDRVKVPNLKALTRGDRPPNTITNNSGKYYYLFIFNLQN